MNRMKIAGVAMMLAALFILGCAQQQDTPMNETNMTGPVTTEPTEPVDEPESDAVEILMTDNAIEPNDLTAEAGTISFRVVNEGRLYNELRIEGNNMSVNLPRGIQANSTRTFDANLTAGTYEVYSPIPGKENIFAATLDVE